MGDLFDLFLRQDISYVSLYVQNTDDMENIDIIKVINPDGFKAYNRP